jgi:hypothetical protein
MFGEKKINVSNELYNKLKLAAEGMAVSVDQLCNKILSEAVSKIISEASATKNLSKEEEQQITDQLKGLGYLD